MVLVCIDTIPLLNFDVQLLPIYKCDYSSSQDCYIDLIWECKLSIYSLFSQQMALTHLGVDIYHCLLLSCSIYMQYGTILIAQLPLTFFNLTFPLSKQPSFIRFVLYPSKSHLCIFHDTISLIVTIPYVNHIYNSILLECCYKNITDEQPLHIYNTLLHIRIYTPGNSFSQSCNLTEYNAKYTTLRERIESKVPPVLYPSSVADLRLSSMARVLKPHPCQLVKLASY